MVNKAPKPFRYTIQYGENELVLTTDPKGWQEHSIGFTRSDDFGLNVETVIALSFSKEGRNLLRSLYEQTGIFTKAFLIIEKRNNDWVYDSFYKYRLDFSTYTDSMNFIDISGIEDGLLSAFSAYKDTEYEITLPLNNFVQFTGISVDRKNLIQSNAGEIYKEPALGTGTYPFRGSRSVRTYSDSLAFVNTNGEPYETMTIRCIKDIVFDLHVKLSNKVIEKMSAGSDGGLIKLIIHTPDFTIIGTPITLTYTADTVSENYLVFYNNTTTFAGDEIVQDISLTEGQCISLCYIDLNGGSLNITNNDGQNTYIEVTTTSGSQYQNLTLGAFTFETLITALLVKIEPTATLTYSITAREYDILLSTTKHIKVIGTTTGNVIIKAKLSDALKALNCLENIGIDITGNVMTIDYKSNLYIGTSADTIECKNIVLKHDTKHQFNKISVGYKVDKREEDENVSYPFNCQKEFEIKNAISESAIDLVNPYISDPYEIENLIIETGNKLATEIDTKFFIFCVQSNIVVDESFSKTEQKTATATGSPGQPYRTVEGYATWETPTNKNIQFTTVGNFVSFDTISSLLFTIPVTGIYNLNLVINAETDTPAQLFSTIILANGYPLTYETVTADVETQTSMVYDGYERSLDADVFLEQGSVISIDFQYKDVASAIFDINIFELTVTNVEVTGVHLYRNHTITNFGGDDATAYNVPITPKRILQKHLNYLSVSNYGNPSDIAYVTSDVESNINVRIEGETATIIENADVPSITPIFLPVTIECDTVTDFSSTFADNKYKYLKIIDQKSGKSYQGWINSITFAPTKKKSTKLILQAKSI